MAFSVFYFLNCSFGEVHFENPTWIRQVIPKLWAIERSQNCRKQKKLISFSGCISQSMLLTSNWFCYISTHYYIIHQYNTDLLIHCSYHLLFKVEWLHLQLFQMVCLYSNFKSLELCYFNLFINSCMIKMKKTSIWFPWYVFT